jgi:inner membrane protein
MQGSTHLAAGILTGAIVARVLRLDAIDTGIAAAVAGVAALVPDWIQINAPGLNKTIRGAFGHRGFSHWVLTGWAAAWLAVQLCPPHYCSGFPLATVVGAGWMSHIVLDSLSSPGVPAFWPYPKRLKLGSFKTGGKLDDWTGRAAAALAMILGLSLLF